MPTTTRAAIKAMPSSSRYLARASSRLSSFKDKIAQYRDDGFVGNQPFPPASPSGTNNGIDDRGAPNSQNWKQWAGQKIKRNLSRNDGKIAGYEEIVLFPGWAAKRYINVGGGTGQEAFEVDVFVSGLAAAYRPPELVTRSQRAFLRLAKGFAALPKLVSDVADPETSPTRETDNPFGGIPLLPGPGGEMSEEYETQILEQQFLKLNTEDQDPDSGISTPLLVSDLTPPPPAQITLRAPTVSGDPRKLHANLESRLRPFWSTALSSRQIRIQLFTSKPQSGPSHTPQPNAREPLAWRDVQTGADGFFSAKLTVTWDEICRHPEAAHLVDGDPGEEHEVFIEVELLSSSAATPREQVSRDTAGLVSQATRKIPRLDFGPLQRSVMSTLFTPLTNSPIRVISDIDDTIKFSNILRGARAAFHNVFVKELEETTIPGMGEWYHQMFTRGVRFHYVSNGPYELLPVVKEFLHISRLPPGSIKLKSYTGRSLFNGLMSAPASRKRTGVVEVLDAFPSSRFFLIGDTGEQDLELYASLAAERPHQIAGVFLRDATDYMADSATDREPPSPTFVNGRLNTGTSSSTGSTSSIEDPTGGKALVGQPESSPPRSPWSDVNGGSYFTAEPLSSEPETYVRQQTTPPSAFVSFQEPLLTRRSSLSMYTLRRRSSARVPELEKKRNELQTRVWRARAQIPVNIPLRVFRRPEECVEVWDVLDRVRTGILSL